MKNALLACFCIIIFAAAMGCKNPPVNEGCTDSGGAITAATCCGSADDFPDLCSVGPCGCAPEFSHTIYICDCAPDKCFNGTACVDIDSNGIVE